MQGSNGESVSPFKWDQYRDAAVDRYLLRHERDFIHRHLAEDGRSGRGLEIGCGSGRVTEQLLNMNLAVSGLDLNTDALGAFRQRTQSVPLVRGDATRLPIATHSIDWIVSIQAVGSFPYRPFLAECSRVLKTNGRLIFQAGNCCNYKRRLKVLLGRLGELDPSDEVKTGEFIQAAQEQGFEVEEVRGYNWIPFGRTSNNPAVGLAAALERIFRLDRRPSASPWILVAARKR